MGSPEGSIRHDIALTTVPLLPTVTHTCFPPLSSSLPIRSFDRFTLITSFDLFLLVFDPLVFDFGVFASLLRLALPKIKDQIGDQRSTTGLNVRAQGPPHQRRTQRGRGLIRQPTGSSKIKDHNLFLLFFDFFLAPSSTDRSSLTGVLATGVPASGVAGSLITSRDLTEIKRSSTKDHRQKIKDHWSKIIDQRSKIVLLTGWSGWPCPPSCPPLHPHCPWSTRHHDCSE